MNGTATDPAPTTTTVVVTREDGTALTSGAATRTSVGTYTFSLSAAQTASLDVLTVAWTSSLGTLTTQAEIAGGFLTSLSELRADSTLANTTNYPTADLITYRTLAETALEDATGVAFVPRYFRGKTDGTGTTDVLTPDDIVRPLSITAAVIGATSQLAGTTLTADELSDLELYRDGRVYYSAGWPEGRRNVALTGTHGYASPPPRVGLAVQKLVKRWLIDTPLGDRVTSASNEGGAVTIAMKEQCFDIPECVTVVSLYGVKEGIA